MLQRLVPVAFALVAAPALAVPESFTLDPYHTFVNFTVDHLGISTLYGRFGKTTGKMSVDRAAKMGSLEVQVDSASVDTGDNERGNRPRSRNEHLRSADFFNAAEFPHLTYKSTRVVWTGEAPTSIEGNVTLIGVSKPVTLKVDRFKCIAERGKERCGGNASANIRRSDFGMKTAIPTVGDEIALLIEFEGVQD